MSSDTSHFVDLIPTWITATRRAKVVAPAPEDLEDRVRRLRERLREGGLVPSDFEPSEENLTVLSHLCALLSLEPIPSPFVLEEVSSLLELVAAIPWPENAFDEKTEILGHLAFIGWRHSRQMMKAGVSQKWMRTYGQAFARPSTWRDRVELFLEKNSTTEE